MISNFLILVPLVVHQEGDSDAVIQAVNHCRKLFHNNIGISHVSDRGTPGIDVEKVGGRVHNGVRLYFLPVVIDEDVLHDRKQPGFKICPWAKFVSISYSAVSGFLKQIFRLFRILRQIISEGL